MHLRVHCSKFKFNIMTLNFGYQIGIRFNNWTTRIPFFVPLEKATLLYSLKHQGLWRSLKNGFWVKT